jgi:hypothetical protein
MHGGVHPRWIQGSIPTVDAQCQRGAHQLWLQHPRVQMVKCVSRRSKDTKFDMNWWEPACMTDLLPPPITHLIWLVVHYDSRPQGMPRKTESIVLQISLIMAGTG